VCISHIKEDCDMKQRFKMAALLLAGVLLLPGCPTPNDDPPPAALESLAGTVWAGETPRAGDWLTISFKNLETAIAGSEETGLRTVWSFGIDNSTNNWGYTYDAATGTGTIVSGGWNPAPDGFSISADGTTLTIVHYGSHAGAPREFKRLRDNKGVVSIAPETIASPVQLAGSVWAGETPRAGDWLTISFKDLETAIAGSEETGLRAVWSFSIDNSSNNWGYTYDAATRTGTVVSGGWNPAPNGFSISADGTTLVITNYGSHEGASRELKRLRAPYEALAGTTWRWGEAVLQFIDGRKAVINSLGWTTDSEGYDYVYHASNLSGAVSGDLNRRSGSQGEIYNKLGPFQISSNGSTLAGLTFSDYRESGQAIVFTRSYVPQPGLIGTIWYGPNFVIECLDNTNAILYALDGYYAATTKLSYTYDSDTKQGNMTYNSGPLNGDAGPFAIIANSVLDVDDWEWRGGVKNGIVAAYHMAFSNWKGYGHGWDFARLGADGLEPGIAAL
jgi:hypothetical protein